MFACLKSVTGKLLLVVLLHENAKIGLFTETCRPLQTLFKEYRSKENSQTILDIIFGNFLTF